MNTLIAERLKDQNTGTSWIDCNAHGVPHRWHSSHVVLSDGEVPSLWFRCERCPVTTRTAGDRPKRFLGVS